VSAARHEGLHIEPTGRQGNGIRNLPITVE